MPSFNVRGISAREDQPYAAVPLDENKDPQLDEYAVLQQRVKRMKRWLVGISCLLGLTCVLLLVSVWESYRQHSVSSTKPSSPVPDMPMVTRVFERDDLYAAASSGQTDQAWGALMPDGDGFVYINDSTLYGLQAGIQSPMGESYDISMFHQLHCLIQIRTYLYTLTASVKINSTEEVMEILLAPQNDHMFHCFDYIRQAIMCAGDMTVEWPREEPDGKRFAVDGWGVPHLCKSWDAIEEYMDRHHV